MEKFIIEESKLGGKGVFAKEKINRGELIKNLSGEIITEQQFLERLSSGSEAYNDPFQIDVGENDEGEGMLDRKYIDLDELSRTFNHSCDPNAGIRNISDLVAIRNIEVGEEITYDYSTTVSKTELEFSMPCNCGSNKCRKIISSVSSIPEEQLKEYKDNNVLPNYIKIQLRLI
jgi:SET domain-containing protein